MIESHPAANYPVNHLKNKPPVPVVKMNVGESFIYYPIEIPWISVEIGEYP
jgi:hypothetical protein